MTTDELAGFESNKGGRLYMNLEKLFPPAAAPAYERLVVASGNSVEPLHRWFKMKEAYSPYLLAQVLSDLKYPDDRPLSILDPFAGSGTTATSALLLGRRAATSVACMEVNPFLALLAGVKMRCLSLSAKGRLELADRVTNASSIVLRSRRGRAPGAPALAAFGNDAYFPPSSLSALLKMRANLDGLDPGLCRDVLSILLAACVEPCSKLRKDGRALRYEADKPIEPPAITFAERVGVAVTDLKATKPTGTATLLTGSATSEESWTAIPGTEWDLCVFSPPYPNNIDYTEVYKLEAWFLGLIRDQEGFRDQRRATMRSHPSILFKTDAGETEPSKSIANELAEELVEAIPDDRYKLQRGRTIRGYLADASSVMTSAFARLRVGGHLVYVVGNSRHGGDKNGYTIASDILLAALAQDAGFEFQSLNVARNLHRRGQHDHLRESVVIVRRP